MALYSRGRSYKDDMLIETQLQPESEKHDVSRHVAAAARSYEENTLLAEHVAA